MPLLPCFLLPEDKPEELGALICLSTSASPGLITVPNPVVAIQKTRVGQWMKTFFQNSFIGNNNLDTSVLPSAAGKLKLNP